MSMDKITHAVLRLKKLRSYLGLTQAEFAKCLGMSRFTVPSWESGAKPFGSLSAQRVVNALHRNLDFACEIEWLLFGRGNSPILLQEIQQQLNYQNVEVLQEKILNEVELFKQLNPNLWIMPVTDNAFVPLAEAGDFVGWQAIALAQGLAKTVYLLNDKQEAFFGLLQQVRTRYKLTTFNDNISYHFKPVDIKQLYLLVWLRRVF